jgi:hypothetical protein
VLGAFEHDLLSLCETRVMQEPLLPEPPPPASSVVDSAIDLFARLLPLQDLSSVTRTVTQILELCRSPKFDKNSGRRAAVLINVAVALVLSLRHIGKSQLRRAREIFGSSQVGSMLSSFLKARFSRLCHA